MLPHGTSYGISAFYRGPGTRTSLHLSGIWHHEVNLGINALAGSRSSPRWIALHEYMYQNTAPEEVFRVWDERITYPELRWRPGELLENTITPP